MRIMPDGEMKSVLEFARSDQIAIAEQHWRFIGARRDPRCEDGHDIRTVRKIGDPAEPFRLALGTVNSGRAIKPHQLRIAGRVQSRHDGEREQARGRIGQCQRRSCQRIVRRSQWLSVERDAFQLEFVAVKDQWALGSGRVGFDRQACNNPRPHIVQRDVEMHILDQMGWHRIVGEADRVGGVSSHCPLSFHYFLPVRYSASTILSSSAQFMPLVVKARYG